jgi:PAS domain S-box-containing protein
MARKRRTATAPGGQDPVRGEPSPEALRALLAATVESTGDGILVVDLAGKVVLQNDRFAKMWRIPAEILGAQDDDRLVAFVLDQLSDPDAFVNKIRELYGRLDAESFDTLNFKDGRVFERYSRSERAEGVVVGRVWSFRDVTSRERARNALRASEARYLELAEHTGIGIYRSTLAGRFIDCNRALARMLGYDSPDEVLALDIEKDVYDDPAERRALVRQFRDTAVIRPADVRWKRKDGTVATIRGNGRAMYNDARVAVGFEMVVNDVTEQRALDKELRQRQKMEALGQLTGGIAHDFNNLLTVIRAGAQLLEGILPPDSLEALHEVHEVKAAADRGATLVRKLMMFGRKQELALKGVDLGHVVAESASTLRRLLPESITLDVQSSEGLGAVMAAPGAVEQILMNLATNARDAMNGEGTIHVRVAKVPAAERARWSEPAPDGNICLSVTDAGAGMDEAIKARVFEPFFTTKPPGAGTGLGLAVVYGLVQNHGASITVESSRGLGTTVCIAFPVVDSASLAAPAERKGAIPTGSKEGVLIVEDEPQLRALSLRILEHAGYTVFAAENGEEALEVFLRNESRVDLIVSDLVMPKMSGRRLFTTLREQNKTVPILFTSGYQSAETGEWLATSADARLLHKPWTAEELLRGVRETLDARQLPIRNPESGTSPRNSAFGSSL